MKLSDNALLIRQPATKEDMERDKQTDQFVSPFSRKKGWTKSKSDRFFVRIKLKLIENGTPLQNVRLIYQLYVAHLILRCINRVALDEHLHPF